MRATLAALLVIGVGSFACGFWSSDRITAIEGFVVQPVPIALFSMVLLGVVLRAYRSGSSH